MKILTYNKTVVDVQDRNPGLLKKAISKISTEYRLQFAWPQGHTSRRDIIDSSTPRKSQSMGALKPAANAMVHKKRTDLENKDGNMLHNEIHYLFLMFTFQPVN